VHLTELLKLLDRAHAAEANFAKTLALLAALKAGKVNLESVVLTGVGWVLTQVQLAPPDVAPPAPTEPVPPANPA